MRKTTPSLILLFLLTAGIAAFAPMPSHASPGVTEAEVKAAFLLNFAKFVDWPETALGEEDPEFIICILGPDPFGTSLDRLLENRTIKGRPVRLLRVETLSPIPESHLVFINLNDPAKVDQALKNIGPALSVGNTTAFEQAGGIIRFVKAGNRIRFRINQAAATDLGLCIRSRLLRLATNE